MMPDCVFTDIKMTSMNGVELSKKVQSQWPTIKVVIVSGYPSFEYAKEALKANVVDFLTKPVFDEDVEEILTKILEEKAIQEHEKVEKQLNYVIRNRNTNLKSEIVHFLNQRYCYFISLYIKSFEGGYPFDFPFPRPSEPLVEKGIKNLIDNNEDVWVLNDSIQGDMIIIIGLNKLNKKKMESIAFETFDYFNKSTMVSLAYSKEYRLLEELINILPSIRNRLYENLRIGKPQIIDASKDDIMKSSNNLVFTEFLKNKLKILILSQKWNQLKNEMNNLFFTWKKEDFTCVVIEQNLKKIVRAVEEQNQIIDPIQTSSIERRLEEIVYMSDTYEELQEAFWQLLTDYLYSNETNPVVKDSELIFSDIKRYLNNNLQEPITLTTLTNMFNISKTQLCNLFRQKVNQSFVEYLTSLRITKAKTLILQSPDLLLKEIAQMVGYTDHFYFSKVFKHHVGMSPRDFKERQGT
jgi:two-component system, response regulator YesN